MDPNREAYPFAGALCVAGELLTRLHEVAGPPPTSAEDLSDHDRALAVAAAAGYGASAACAALAGRLLLIERAASRALIPEVAEAGLPEAGITTLDPVESRAWRQTVWAAAATRVELERCAAALSAQGAPDMPGVHAAFVVAAVIGRQVDGFLYDKKHNPVSGVIASAVLPVT